MLYMPKLVGSAGKMSTYYHRLEKGLAQNMNLVHMRILCAKFVKLVQLSIPDPEIFKGWESLRRGRGYQVNILEKLQVYSQNKRVYTKSSNKYVLFKFKGSFATAYPLPPSTSEYLRYWRSEHMTTPMPTVQKPISIKLRRGKSKGVIMHFDKLKKTL